MKRSLISAILLLVATGYVVSYCFHAMNLPDDLFYIGGIVGLVLWFFFVVPLVYRKLIKEKRDEKANSNIGGSNSTAASSGMHNADRPGNGGNRSGPVGESAGST